MSEFPESDSDSLIAFEDHPFAGECEDAEGGGEGWDAVRQEEGGVGERCVHAIGVCDGGFILDWVVESQRVAIVLEAQEYGGGGAGVVGRLEQLCLERPEAALGNHVDSFAVGNGVDGVELPEAVELSVAVRLHLA